MNRDAARYLAWLEQGNTSAHYDAILAALTDQPATRREIAAAAGCSLGFARTAVEVAVARREAKRAGVRRDQATRWHGARAYVARSSKRRAVLSGTRRLSFEERRQLKEAVSDARRERLAGNAKRKSPANARG